MEAKTHKLKIEAHFLVGILAGKKKAEVRCNDRDYQVGDILELYKIDKYGGIVRPDEPNVKAEITHIHSGLGMADNYVMMSFIVID